ncbi:hypothetical protein JOD57_002449 [Geodermatophilus bullaregiensis]|uniref:DUF3566 domain-containing protein n=1 Tax=Geodermatophilus bullaregiensis TaxID=1564160 RepID=UPI0019586B17|nr:DUF3566 domain-containing protein [Geodermatophilus bullaregiensis]MBM7806612.1 hypothetical protein [Geodermatophilus bullaregiensis]
MSDRPQAVRTGVRPDGAGADRAPGADPSPAGPAGTPPAGGPSAGGAPAGGPPTGASAAGASAGGAPAAGAQTGAAPAAQPATGGAPSLSKPDTGQVPAQPAGQQPAGAAPPPAGAGPGSSGTTQTITPVAAAAAPPPAAARGGQPAAGKAPKRGPRGPRRARLQLRHIDTWSALKISLVLSIALFFIWMVAVGVLYGVLSGLGVFDTLNDLFGQLGTASGAEGGEGGGNVITPGIVFGGAAVIGAINIVLMTALCTVAAFIYNLCADLVGGLEVTLAERE